MKKYKIIIDTNLWISLLIGKRTTDMYSLCNSDVVDVYICDELTDEFERIASHQKIRKYVANERVFQTLDLMNASCILSPIAHSTVSSVLRDVNDMYLLSLADAVKADFILTGDKDLLSLQSHNQTKIVTFREFEAILQKIIKL